MVYPEEMMLFDRISARDEREKNPSLFGDSMFHFACVSALGECVFT